MRILVTGSAGFIGYHTAVRLCKAGYDVVGIDNLNNYYDVNLKLARLGQCGIRWEDIAYGREVSSQTLPLTFCQIDLADEAAVNKLFMNRKFDLVCNLAAQAGVRYSVENPKVYISSNINGFLHILEGCRNFDVPRMVYASSSSVYGNNAKIPFSVNDSSDHPISLYAATKKSNELISYCYTHLFKIDMIGLRFFTVYGPWGRPDMALFKFTRSIVDGKAIPVFNYGKMQRDFTYIDDIVEGIYRTITFCLNRPSGGEALNKIYNLGNGSPVALTDFIAAIEKCVGKKAVLNLLPLQQGDVNQTWAEMTEFQKDFDFRPATKLQDGVEAFVKWYRMFYNK